MTLKRIYAEYREDHAQLDRQFGEQLRRTLGEIEPAIPGLLVHSTTHPEKVDGCPSCAVTDAVAKGISATHYVARLEEEEGISDALDAGGVQSSADRAEKVRKILA